MINNLNILYFLYRSKTKTDGTIPICCRITVNGVRKQFSTSHSVREKVWNNKNTKS
ncbi:Arm DNA-binding domain-containing protein [Solitalea canadensis]|uniref:Arm DNA-binding domain-containing protein n=1 Tax=Solitalea canadensis TaxID=995 RepID=UPI0009DA2666|nr:Arm DNA-binding domain-containing protein [Solitalea canadensis]